MKTGLVTLLLVMFWGLGWGQTLLDYEGRMLPNMEYLQLISGNSCGDCTPRIVAPRGKDYALIEQRWQNGCPDDHALTLSPIKKKVRYWFSITTPRTISNAEFGLKLSYQDPNPGEKVIYDDLELVLEDEDNYPIRFSDNYSSKWSDGNDTLAIIAFTPERDYEQVTIRVLSRGISSQKITAPMEICVASAISRNLLPLVPSDPIHTGEPDMLWNNDTLIPMPLSTTLYNPSNNFWSGISPFRLDIDPIIINRLVMGCSFVDQPRSVFDTTLNGPLPRRRPHYNGGYGLDPKEAGCATNWGMPRDQIAKGLHNLKIYWFNPEEDGFYSIRLDTPNHPTSLIVFLDRGFQKPTWWNTGFLPPYDLHQEHMFQRLAPEICNDIAVGGNHALVDLPGELTQVEFIGSITSDPSQGDSLILFSCESEQYEFFSNKMYYVVISGPVSGFPLLLSDSIAGRLMVNQCECFPSAISLPPDHPKNFDTYAWVDLPLDTCYNRRLKIESDTPIDVQVYRYQDRDDLATYTRETGRKVMPRVRNQSLDVLNAPSCALRILVAYQGDAPIHLDIEAESLDPPPSAAQARRRR